MEKAVVSRLLVKLLMLLLVLPSCRPQPRPGTSVAVTEGIPGDAVDGYWLYLPRSHHMGKKWPILIFLHGGDQVGGRMQRVRWDGPTAYVDRANEDDPALDMLIKNTFIIVNPHLSIGRIEERQWYQQAETLEAILDSVMARYAGDPSRVYLTGLSRGGHGCWGLASRLKNRITAIIPISGSAAGVSDFAEIKDMPMWVVHNTGDNVVGYNEALEGVRKVEAAEGDPFLRLSHAVPSDSIYLTHRHLLTSYDREGHNAWTESYDNPQLYTWMLQFTRAGR